MPSSDDALLAAESKRLEKEERRRKFLASHPDLALKTKPSKSNRRGPSVNPKQPTTTDSKVAPKGTHSKTQSSDEKGNANAKQANSITKLADQENSCFSTTKTCRGLFDHLQSFKRLSSAALNIKIGSTHEIHPSFLAVGLGLAKQTLLGANSRSLALLTCISQLLDDYECRTEKNFSRDFETVLGRHISFVKTIASLTVAMRNVISAINSSISKLDPTIAHSQAKRELSQAIQKYSDERIVFAINAIVKLSEDRIQDGDSLMIYSRCHLIEDIIVNSYKKGVVFRVIVADSSPYFHGRQTLRRLIRNCPELSCSYVLIQSVTFAMKEVTKVFLSATAMMSNGAAQGRVGTAVVAVMAQTYHIPCIMVCESRKFSDDAQVNAVTRNELCDPEPLLQGNLRDVPGLSILNLAYDITPAHLITMVISEVGCIPATSVPAVTREFLKSTST